MIALLTYTINTIIIYMCGILNADLNAYEINLNFFVKRKLMLLAVEVSNNSINIIFPISCCKRADKVQT